MFFKFENIFFQNFVFSGSRLQAQHHINRNIPSKIISIQSDNSIIVIMPPAVAWSQMEIQDWRHVKPHLKIPSVKKYAIGKLMLSVSYIFPYGMCDIKKRKLDAAVVEILP